MNSEEIKIKVGDVLIKLNQALTYNHKDNVYQAINEAKDLLIKLMIKL